MDLENQFVDETECGDQRAQHCLCLICGRESGGDTDAVSISILTKSESSGALCLWDAF